MQLNYLLGQPQQAGRLKAEFADFIVREELGYPLSGEGEFVAVKIRKTNANTLFVGERLAKFAGISERNMSYAGLKDRHAVTEQWFCLHLAGKETPDFTQFECEGVEVLEVTRHNRKIRVGSLAGNHFELLLRDVNESEELNQRLNRLQAVGFPNYFTEQRFGRDGHNLTQSLRWANGEIAVKDRKKRSFYLSAARSEVFNLVVSQRIADHLTQTVLAGDYVQLAGSNSFFMVEEKEVAETQQRLASGDVLLTAPLIGEKSLELTACEQEKAIIAQHSTLVELMKKERMANARRAMLCKPQDFSWRFEAEGLRLRFFLDSGSYATALVRELIQLTEQE
ncbi:tRNA pseudouridine synthase D [Actinobacillus pleuropneumoniae]|uniref:tRNA pseudouridine synthase D n=5 Tax=Actinobacillus pleuropneumoniae TaxID=715 RepID=A3N3M0_ACTP2|nr:tRNA pseudouridine(13) synthase TruD [Actinobacillus pleuropneumoniae]ABN75006.1 tRNA pseudouridine synthase D [Actinobacillus pleuropneumoniae serovar 5b str. L20]ASU15802.1 tRNA pseudouridine synthase D [Actinobacillus pleuropneumoniae]AWG96336.1 tRNA pseudouridine(13) synthase TruD [Actinobacillus pleuropneumoniae serovar 1 str. 4074]AXA22406.1 tRNA pseudouridine(13) synthase TruD [Actinobacillus pleuropneumoniae]EFL79319.1 tRNA pseudouridine synthase D [Actinobacillus pleuropneumoniae s